MRVSAPCLCVAFCLATNLALARGPFVPLPLPESEGEPPPITPIPQ